MGARLSEVKEHQCQPNHGGFYTINIPLRSIRAQEEKQQAREAHENMND